MGFFESLFGGGKRRVEQTTDRIWLSLNAKYAGVAKELDQRAKTEAVAVLLVAHFPDVLDRLSELAGRQAYAHVRPTLARDLSGDLASSLRMEEQSTIELIVAERHPLPSAERRLEQFAEESDTEVSPVTKGFLDKLRDLFD